MNIKKFYGKSSREALAKVKQALGENAIILANRSVNGGTEITAINEHDMLSTPDFIDEDNIKEATYSNDSVQELENKEISFLDFISQKQKVKSPFEKTLTPARTEAKSDFVTQTKPVNNDATSEINKVQLQQKVQLKQEESINKETVSLAKENSETIQQSSHRPLIKDAQLYEIVTQTLEEKMRVMMNEMRDMRLHFESQMNAMTWQHHLQHNPAKSKVLSTLLAASFSASLARQIAEKLPNHIDINKAPQWAKEIITRNLHTVEDENILLDKGGVYALVGPTGVGKTTTIAKLAARYVMKHGTQSLGLISTDSYRIGGHEQLRIYGKILGVMVHAVKDEEDLKITLKELSKKHMILVDTVGVSQRDMAVSEQLALLNKCETHIHKLLCLNATSTGETLTDVLHTYKPFDMTGCIVTKLDEAAAIGNVIDVLIRERMRLFYTTNGQRVPEDIEIANKQSLIERVMTFNNASWPYQYLEEELPLVVSNIHLEHHSNNKEADHV